jgi:hypothetical protein
MRSAAFYQPWIGEHYANPKSGHIPSTVRLLILSESVYGNDEWVKRASYPKDLVQWRIFENDDPADQFLFGLTQCFEEVPRNSKQAQAIWLDVAFWEYVQEPLEGHSQSPTEPQFRRGHAAFEEILEELKPTHVWVVSKRLWQNMTDDRANGVGESTPNGETVVGPSSFGCYRYERSFGSVLVWGTYHPARPQWFKPAAVRPCLKSFLDWHVT